MIVFDLKCSKNHVFEAWFRSSAAWEDQRAAGKVICPICQDRNISKAIMAPAVSTVQNHRQQSAPALLQPERPTPELTAQQQSDQQERQAETGHAVEKALADMAPEQVQTLVQETYKAVRHIQKTVEANADNVGRQFADEARAMHYGEMDHRPIYGETDDKEAQDLEEEGIAFTRLPWLPREDA